MKDSGRTGKLPRFLIDADSIRDRKVSLTGNEARHMRVRRLRPGRRVALVDSAGIEHEGVITRLAADGAEVEVDVARRPERESALHLILAQAVLKAPRLDPLIEKTAELGVTEIILFNCTRSVPRPPAARTERWARIAASAAKQSGRLRLPVVKGPVGFDHLLDDISAGRVRAVLFDPNGTPLIERDVAASDALMLVVGPEGGFTSHEVEHAAAAGCKIASLGPRVLRGETAGITVVALAQFLWGDLARRLA